LGIEVAGELTMSRSVEGAVEMRLNAIQQYDQPLTDERLFAWHAAMFPAGRSGLYKIQVGAWRDDTGGPMHVVSGAMGKERVHYDAPGATVLNREMKKFLRWFNNNKPGVDPVLKAAIAHFWVVTIHPFDDGNGRIARAIADMQLARADGSRQRFYSMSAQIQKERNLYYEILEKTQKGTLDITKWLLWFLACLDKALVLSLENLSGVIQKAKCWETH
jgi:Fic family protein